MTRWAGNKGDTGAPVETQEKDTIVEVKSKIQGKMGTPPDQQCIIKHPRGDMQISIGSSLREGTWRTGTHSRTITSTRSRRSIWC